MNKSQIDQIQRQFSGPITDRQLNVLRDMQGWIEFCIQNGLTFHAALGILAHDVNRLLQYQEADSFLPKTDGYARIVAELPAQMAEMANDPEIRDDIP